MNSPMINAAEIQATMPHILLENEKMAALGYAVSVQIKKRRDMLKMINYYAHIDILEESQLDSLARSLGLGWYGYNYPTETKRLLLKQAGAIKRREGTQWAVETVLKAVFGNDVKVRYWYENNVTGLEENQFEVTSVIKRLNEYDVTEAIERVKRASAVLKGIKKVPTWDGEYCFDGTICFDGEAR